MKYLVLLATVVIVASAAADGDFQFFNPRYQQFQQNGPYEPSGWRPSGARFSLPLRQQLPRLEYPPPPPQQEYGPPPNEYGPPPAPPASTTTETPETTTTELPTTTDNVIESEQIKSNEVEKSGKIQEENPGATEQGVYYIYHPTGLLQRVAYTTRDDSQNMAYTAQLKYQNVDPIREPIFTYDPQTYIFRRLQV